jgi:hypothetical protein
MTDAKEPLVRYGYRLCVRDDSAHRDAERAVIEAAKAQLKTADALRTHSCILEICIHDKEHTRACIRVEDAVTALRALEGDA